MIQRENNRDITFVADGDDEYYLQKSDDACIKHDCDLHAYVLMISHVHLLITPHTENGISKLMQYVGWYYVQYFNFQYQRTGTLWEGRYKACLIQSEQYLLEIYRYIELTPVRAAMVEEPSDYSWSSYAINALGVESDLQTPHLEYLALGKTKAERLSNYRELFKAQTWNKFVERNQKFSK